MSEQENETESVDSLLVNKKTYHNNNNLETRFAVAETQIKTLQNFLHNAPTFRKMSMLLEMKLKRSLKMAE